MKLDHVSFFSFIQWQHFGTVRFSLKIPKMFRTVVLSETKDAKNPPSRNRLVVSKIRKALKMDVKNETAAVY